MIRKLIATVTVAGGLVFSVYVATNSPVQRQVNELADAGRVPNRNATCPVRLDEDFAADAGLRVYQRPTFPVSLVQQRDIVWIDGGQHPTNPDGGVSVSVMPKDVLVTDVPSVLAYWGPPRSQALPDGGSQVMAVDVGHRDIQMPPMPLQRVRDSIDVVDWGDCTLAAATAPVQALWGTQRPFTLAGVVKPWCRAKLDAGFPCLRTLSDGGTASFGDRNVYPCAQAVAPATCERVPSGVIYLGDSEEDL